jgi:hypothetical protein
MSYYFCKNCGYYFAVVELSDDGCPNCKAIHYLKEIDKESYIQWLASIYYSNLFSERQDEKRWDRWYDTSVKIWRNYDLYKKYVRDEDDAGKVRRLL